MIQGREFAPLLVAMVLTLLAGSFAHWGMPFFGPPSPTGESPRLVEAWHEMPPRADVPLTAKEAHVASYHASGRWGRSPFLTDEEAERLGPAFAFVSGAEGWRGASPGDAGPRLTAIIRVEGREEVALIDGEPATRGATTGDVQIVEVAERDVVIEADGTRRVLGIAEPSGVNVTGGAH